MNQQYELGDIANGHVLTPQGWLPLQPPPPLLRPVRLPRKPMTTGVAFAWIGAGLALFVGLIWIGVAVSDATAARKQAECQAWNTEWSQAAKAEDTSKEKFFAIFDRQPQGCEVADEKFVYNIWHIWWNLQR